MDSKRLDKINKLILKELGDIFQKELKPKVSSLMITVTHVKVTSDLGYANVYLSVFGDLNSVLITTYHDGDSVFSEGFHFKWKNMPDHMILQDSDGFEWDFIPMSLEYALQIRATKSIRDY